MIEREPFLIRNGLRIFTILAVVGLFVLIVVGIRFQVENAEFSNDERRFRTRVPNAVELKASCDFFGGQFVGMPSVAPGSPAPGLMDACDLGGTAAASLQCVYFDGAWGRGSCNVDVATALQGIPRQSG
jgi:hypothetical protein